MIFTHFSTMFQLTLLSLINISGVFCNTPAVTEGVESLDPSMIQYLEKMKEGYNKALLFREEQMPVMNYQDEIIVFNDDTFEDHIIDFDAILIFFHGSGCSKCKEFIDEYVETGQELLKNDPHISMGMMDCSREGSKTCSRYRVPRLPWFKLFKQGKDHSIGLSTTASAKSSNFEHPDVITSATRAMPVVQF